MHKRKSPCVTYLSEKEQENALDTRSWKRRRLLPWCLHGPGADWVKGNTPSETSRSQKFSAKFHGRRGQSGAEPRVNPLTPSAKRLAHVCAGEGADLCAEPARTRSGSGKIRCVYAVEGDPSFRGVVSFFGFLLLKCLFWFRFERFHGNHMWYESRKHRCS